MRAQTEKTTFTCKDDFLLTKRTRRWTYSALLYFYSRIKTGKFIYKICSVNIIFEMVSIEVSTRFDAPFCFYISRLLRHLKKWFCTVFNSPAIAESKNIKIYILDLKLANANKSLSWYHFYRN